MSASPSPQRLEECREFWARVARENGWYKELFFVQVWIDTSGEITDSVSHRDLDRHYILDEDDSPVLPECPRCSRELVGSSQTDIGSCTGCSGS